MAARGKTPTGIFDSYGNLLPPDPLQWQYKGNKGGQTYLQYIAYARPNVTASQAGWLIIKNYQDAYGNLIARKTAVTANAQQAFFDQVFDSSTALTISAITKAADGEVTTTADHGLSTGDVVEIVGVAGMVEVNSDTTYDATGDGAIVFSITKVDATKFTLGVATSGYTTYTSGGTCRAKTLFGLNFA